MSAYLHFLASFEHKYFIQEWRHAIAILKTDFSEQFNDIVEVPKHFELRKSNVVTSGGKSKISGHIDNKLYCRGWQEKGFDTSIIIDGEVHKTPAHKVDCVKGRVALDTEWNNKTEFYDRDLNNFRLLNALDAISVGIIVARATELQSAIFNFLGIGPRYGASTTHLDKLIPKIEGGGAGGCPLLVLADSYLQT